MKVLLDSDGIENRIKDGSIKAYFKSNVTKINEESIIIKTGKKTFSIPNDFVIAMTGYKPNYSLIDMLGIKLKNDKILEEEKNISALSWYWTFLLVVWLGFFLMIYVFNDAFIEWCKTLVA